MMVCSRRAPMFSVASFTAAANLAISCKRFVGESQLDAFRFEQRDVLLHQRALGLLQDADEILRGERMQLHPDGKAALQFGNQVGRLGDVEGPAAMNRMWSVRTMP